MDREWGVTAARHSSHDDIKSGKTFLRRRKNTLGLNYNKNTKKSDTFFFPGLEDHLINEINVLISDFKGGFKILFSVGNFFSTKTI